MESETRALRERIRAGEMTGQTSGLAAGRLQGNLVVLPAAYAADFLLFCQRNPKPCPLLAVTEPGETALPTLGDAIDVRRDLPAYRVRDANGDTRRVTDVTDVWRDDLVSFVLGCSFSFEEALVAAGIPVRHSDAGRNVPMYRTTIDTTGAGVFSGPLVVSLRGFTPANAIDAIAISSTYPLAHGAPVHLGDAATIGIESLNEPDFGDPPVLHDGDVPVFWACGVTPQLALSRCESDLVITHDPGHMLVTDIPAAFAERYLRSAMRGRDASSR